MTKQEIQALIDAKIAGQGSAVDVGGALPAILSEILNLATAPPEMHVLRVLSFSEDSESEADALARLTLDGEPVTKEQLMAFDIVNTIVINSFQAEDFISMPTSFSCNKAGNGSLKIISGSYLGTDAGYGFHIRLDGNDSGVFLEEL